MGGTAVQSKRRCTPHPSLWPGVPPRAKAGCNKGWHSLTSRTKDGYTVARPNVRKFHYAFQTIRFSGIGRWFTENRRGMLRTRAHRLPMHRIGFFFSFSFVFSVQTRRSKPRNLFILSKIRTTGKIGSQGVRDRGKLLFRSRVALERAPWTCMVTLFMKHLGFGTLDETGLGIDRYRGESL